MSPPPLSPFPSHRSCGSRPARRGGPQPASVVGSWPMAPLPPRALIPSLGGGGAARCGFPAHGGLQPADTAHYSSSMDERHIL
uniref:Uncharacterized protein n=1 Tax=Zea mays TaxID=4577 RepID=B6TCD2_MAIZE|nr:hypothetical protein [Zea mays]